jgi:hypothetical protein
VKDLGDTLQWLLDAVEMWLQCATKPVATLNDILPEVTDEKHLSAAAKVWIPSLLISLIISFPVLKIYGIEWSNVGYHLCTWITTIIALVATAFIFHQVLLLLHLKSDFIRTLVIYTVLVATYAPVTSLLLVPSTVFNFAAVSDFKQHPVAINAAMVAYFQKASNPTSFFSGVMMVTSAFISVFSLGILALFAESISQWYSNNRFKCYSVVVLSLLLSVIVTLLVVTPMQFVIMYAFVGIGPS